MPGTPNHNILWLKVLPWLRSQTPQPRPQLASKWPFGPSCYRARKLGRGRRPTRERPNRIGQSERDWAGANPLQLRRELTQRRADKAKPDSYAALIVEKAMTAIANESHHTEREITR